MAFASSSVRAADRHRGKNLMVARVEEEGVPLEDHDEAHHHHREQDEQVPDHTEVPVPERQRPEQQDEERAGDREDSERLDDAGLRIALRRERFRVEEAAEEMANQLPVHGRVDTGRLAVVSDYFICSSPAATARDAGAGRLRSFSM